MVTLKSAPVFEQIKAGIKDQPDLVKKVNAIVLYVLTKDGKEIGKYTLDLKNGNGTVYEGDVKGGDKATTTLTVEDTDFVDLAQGKLNPQKAFMSGKIKAKGNVLVLQKMQGIFQGQQQKAKL